MQTPSVRQKQKQMIGILPKEATKQKQKQAIGFPYPTVTPIITVPPYKGKPGLPPPIIKIPNLYFKKSIRLPQLGTQRKFYQPSLIAREFKITGKVTPFTGIAGGLRPLKKKRKKKR